MFDLYFFGSIFFISIMLLSYWSYLTLVKQRKLTFFLISQIKKGKTIGKAHEDWQELEKK